MPPAIVFRSPPARVYAVLAWLVAAVVVVAFASHGGVAEVLRYGALPAVLAVAGWVAFWRPELRVDRDGLLVVNLLSTTRLPWGAIRGTKTRWGLELVTAQGTVGVWALPARSSLGRWQAGRQPPPPVPSLAGLDADARGGGDPVVVAALVEEHRTGVDGGEPGTAPDRRLDPVPAGLLLLTAALALVALLL